MLMKQSVPSISNAKCWILLLETLRPENVEVGNANICCHYRASLLQAIIKLCITQTVRPVIYD